MKNTMAYMTSNAVTAAAPSYGGVVVPTRLTNVREESSSHFADVTAYAEAPLWFARSARIVNDLLALGPNWDSADSPPPTTEAHAIAVRVLGLLPRYQLTAPHIAPVAGGGIQFGWYFADQRLEVEILPDGSVEYFRSGSDGETDEGSLPAGHTLALDRHLRWIAT